MTNKKLKSPPLSSKGIQLSVEEAFGVALKLHQGGNLDEAETLYQRTLDAWPDHLDTLHFFGVLCHQQQRQKEAARLIRRIIEIDPKNADAHNNLGNVLESLGRSPEAEVCYRNAIALNSGHAPAHNNLGVVLMARKAVKEALDIYGRAVTLAPESADYRYNQANALRKCDRIDDALAAYYKAVELDAMHVGAWQGLCRTLIKADRKEEAGQVFAAWLEKDPDNSFALYLQAAFEGQGAPGRAPDSYVQKTFDDLADSFDDHLQKNLDYRAPQLLMDALAGLLAPPDASLEILDAGCGTGLCGSLLKPYARQLTGVDLSAGMLTRAKGVAVYDVLAQAELTGFLYSQKSVYDVIFSADTLCYFGDLELVLKGASGALKPGGILAFTLENASPSADNWQLNPHGRYTHASKYVEQVLEAIGYGVQILEPVILRKEGGQPVRGHLIVTTLNTVGAG